MTARKKDVGRSDRYPSDYGVRDQEAKKDEKTPKPEAPDPPKEPKKPEQMPKAPEVKVVAKDEDPLKKLDQIPLKEDNRIAVKQHAQKNQADNPNAKFIAFESLWGHFAGGPGTSVEDVKFLDGKLKELLAS